MVLGDLSLQGGILLIDSGSLQAGNATLVRGSAAVEGGTLALGGSFEQDDGTIFLLGYLTAADSIIFAGGTCTLDGGILTASAVFIAPGGSVAGPGVVAGGLTNAGSLTVADGASGLTVNGGFAQTATGTLTLALSSAGYDVLQVDGGAALGGALVVRTLGGFQPGPYESFSLVQAGSSGGGFAAVALPALSTGSWVTDYSSGFTATVWYDD